jgi:rod shape-determining protein MreB
VETLSQTPPELAADIYNTGIYYLAGGGSAKRFGQTYFKKTDLPVYIAED